MALALAGFGAGPADAVLLGTDDPTGNTVSEPPSPDPGLGNVAVIDVFTGVYLRNGWVLTAAHVGVKPTRLAGRTYDPVPGSAVILQNPGGGNADLMVFKLLDAAPALRRLEITDTAPTLGLDVTLIGHGLNRGVALPKILGHDGWDWGVGWVTRWGTNAISDLDADGRFSIPTESFAMRFDDIAEPAPGQHEAHCTHGDSGGPVFGGAGARLVGILINTVSTLPSQPVGSSYFTNHCVAADLFQFRSQIRAVVDQPACSDGLDDDGDGLTDHPEDPGCASPLDADERGPDSTCDDRVDEDRDGVADYPNDPKCASPTSDGEPLQAPSASLGGGLLAAALYAATARLLPAPTSVSVSVDAD